MPEERITNKELMRSARQQLKGKWSGPVGRTVLFLLFSAALVSMTSIVEAISFKSLFDDKNFSMMWDNDGLKNGNSSMCTGDHTEGETCCDSEAHNEDSQFGKKGVARHGDKDGGWNSSKNMQEKDNDGYYRWGMIKKWRHMMNSDSDNHYGYNSKGFMNDTHPAKFIGLHALKSILGHIFSFILMFGLMVYFLQFSRNNIDKTLLYVGFRPRFAFKTVITYIYRNILVLLNFLLLIVPGIRAYYSYSMMPYILSDNPDMPISEILEESRAMMQGYRMKLFLLHLRFLGWIILALIPVGLGLLWLIPYIQLSVVNFYEDVKNQQSIPAV